MAHEDYSQMTHITLVSAWSWHYPASTNMLSFCIVYWQKQVCHHHHESLYSDFPVKNQYSSIKFPVGMNMAEVHKVIVDTIQK